MQVKSPTVPFRLVVVELTGDVRVCVLCGPAPSLIDLERMVLKHWRSSLPLLTAVKAMLPRGYPNNLQIDRSILG